MVCRRKLDVDRQPHTVEHHVTEILAGLKVENRATAIVRALEFCAAENMKR